MTQQSFVIGVAGGTASGKSHMCKKIRESLQGIGIHAVHLNINSFFRELTPEERHLADSRELSFSHPDFIDEDKLVKTVEDVKNGQSIQVPTFTRWQLPCKTTIKVNPGDIILLEGSLVLWCAKVRALLDMSIYVAAASDVRLSRIVLRESVEARHTGEASDAVEEDASIATPPRQRPSSITSTTSTAATPAAHDDKQSLDRLLSFYLDHTKPTFEAFVLPTKKFADLIVPRGDENQIAQAMIVERIRILRSSPSPPQTRSGSTSTSSPTTASTTNDTTAVLSTTSVGLVQPSVASVVSLNSLTTTSQAVRPH